MVEFHQFVKYLFRTKTSAHIFTTGWRQRKSQGITKVSRIHLPETMEWLCKILYYGNHRVVEFLSVNKPKSIIIIHWIIHSLFANINLEAKTLRRLLRVNHNKDNNNNNNKYCSTYKYNQQLEPKNTSFFCSWQQLNTQNDVQQQSVFDQNERTMFPIQLKKNSHSCTHTHIYWV